MFLVGNSSHRRWRHQTRTILWWLPKNLRELFGPLRQRLLQQQPVPSQHQGLYCANRRSDRNRQRRHLDLEPQVRGRIQRQSAPHWPRHDLNGKWRPKHKCQPILHLVRRSAASGSKVHSVRSCYRRIWCYWRIGETACKSQNVSTTHRETNQQCDDSRKSAGNLNRSNKTPACNFSFHVFIYYNNMPLLLLLCDRFLLLPCF